MIIGSLVKNLLFIHLYLQKSTKLLCNLPIKVIILMVIFFLYFCVYFFSFQTKSDSSFDLLITTLTTGIIPKYGKLHIKKGRWPLFITVRYIKCVVPHAYMHFQSSSAICLPVFFWIPVFVSAHKLNPAVQEDA